VGLLLLFAVVSNGAAVELKVYPASIQLHHKKSSQRIVVQYQDEVVAGQVLEGLKLEVENPKVAILEGEFVKPVMDGETHLIATLGDLTKRIPVKVSGQSQEFRWSFRNHVESVLSKAGCNGGACHGARAGQNGFRLTLFGFDLAADYSYLTRQARGRRIVPSDPGRSLLLTKPTGALPHKGGVRLDVNEIEYRVLAEWIAAGAPGPGNDDPVIETLEVLPPLTTQKVGATQQLVVMAHFSDGHAEDVTRWAKYTSVDLNVANVGKH
ncbi:MAG: S-layer protein, partial [Pirellulales bacterium]|nr:S-layer protein [Pirellulales bacterium]